MAELLIITHDTGSDPTSSWTNPTYAWDGSATTYANRNIAAATDETTLYLLFTGKSGYTVPNYQITKVEVGVRRQDNGGSAVHCAFMPVFGGTTDGPAHNLARTSTLATVYTNITSDAGAPSPWTAADVQNLDVKVWGHNTSASPLGTRIAEVYIRITYTALYYAKPGTSEVQDDEFNTGSLDGMWTQDFKTNGGYAFDVDTPGSICITAGDSSIVYPNCIYQPNITGDFSIEVEVVSFSIAPYPTFYGLLIYIDSTHYYFIGISADDGGTFRWWVNGGSSSSGYGITINTHFKAVRVGTSVTMYNSTNGETWTSPGGSQSIGSGDCRICLCAVTDDVNIGKNAEFNYIRNSVSAQTPISVYKDNTGMTHYLGLQTNSEPLYALASAVGDPNESAIRVRIDGTTYSIKTQR